MRIATLVCSVLPLAFAASVAAPVAGSWKLNLSKSQYKSRASA